MHHIPAAEIPPAFCWTRFGTEAGEPIEAILERKERERRANGGVFFWGVGNSVAPGIAALLECSHAPEVLFSPIRSSPRVVDVRPAWVVTWAAGETLEGDPFILPPEARVTSRGSGSRQRAHYALVCHSEKPLQLSDLGRVAIDQLRNLVSGRRVGASQITAVVSARASHGKGPDYKVALRARLVTPYFVRLREPLLRRRFAA